MVTLKDGTIGVRSFHRAFPVDAVCRSFRRSRHLHGLEARRRYREMIEFTVHLLAERYASE